jgi:hypothetical protein
VDLDRRISDLILADFLPALLDRLAGFRRRGRIRVVRSFLALLIGEPVEFILVVADAGLSLLLLLYLSTAGGVVNLLFLGDGLVC